MELTSEYFELAHETMEYLARGEGSYLIDASKKSDLISVDIKIVKDENNEIVVSSREGEPHQFFADIRFVKQDETRGTIGVCFAPVSFVLLNSKKISLKDGALISDELSKLKEELQKDSSFNAENTFLWAKCLMNYVGKGHGVHLPNFVDSALGMSRVTVYWDPVSEVVLLDEKALMYSCSVGFGTHELTFGRAAFRVMPYEIFFSS